MNRNTVIIALGALVILAILGGYLVARSNQVGNTSTTTTTPSTNMSTAPQSNNEGSVAQQSVSIKGMAFAPASITIKKGTTVTWKNDDSVAHTVVETDGKTGPNSSTIDPNGSFTFTFTNSGTYQYHCSIHPNMIGTIVVTE